MEKKETKNKSASAIPGETAVMTTEPEEPEMVVICLRIIGGAKISIDVARDKHDGRNGLCSMTCGNQCVRSRGMHTATKAGK